MSSPVSDLRSTLAYIRDVRGYLSEPDATLLFDSASLALRSRPNGEIVEVGSYHGRSTIVLGVAVRRSGTLSKIWAVDPHEGDIPKPGSGTVREPSSWKDFLENVRGVGLLDPDGPVIPIRKRSVEVFWNSPISLLFVDGLHDADSVRTDWAKFGPSVVPGGFVAFHDYWNDDYPDVRRVVDELLFDNELVPFASSMARNKEDCLVVTRKADP